MNTLIKISAIITSGGKSRRFGSNKLLELIEGKTVIETTISKFLGIVDEIVVPCSDEIKQFLLSKFENKIKFALPGSTRQKSVYNGILACSNPEIVLIHDGARPFVDKEIIKKTIQETYKNKAVLCGIWATDTVKTVQNGIVESTLDRSKIFFAHTPQAFDYNLIKKVHEFYKDKEDFTDDCSMAERYGVKVHIIEDIKSNIKITTKDDLI